MMLCDRFLDLALPAALAALATVLSKTAYVAGRPPPARGLVVAVALLGWLWTWRRVRAWAEDDPDDAGRAR
jgi:ABC-type dipeptide/oligopeptide/nickel transport system permease subunit